MNYKGSFFKDKGRSNSGGFTLVELVIVIIIVGILSTIAVPMYRSYVRRAMSSEGDALLGCVSSAQRIYYAKYGSYYINANANSVIHDQDFDLDLSENKYFKTVSITSNDGATNYVAQTSGDGTGDASDIVVTLNQTHGAAPVISKTGL